MAAWWLLRKQQGWVSDMNAKRGLFIVFEGVDGCGKTTQARNLAAKMQGLGCSVVLTREPGGTEIGGKLRQLLLLDDCTPAWETEVLLMAADRAQHVAEVLKPALANGAVVISDRYVYSSLAYQGFGAQRPYEAVREVNNLAMQGLVPHLTIFLAIPPDNRYLRPEKEDRIERRGLEYQQRVYEGFRYLADNDPNCATLEVVGRDEADVADLVWRICLERFPDLLI